MADKHAIRPRARVRKSGRGMTEGLIWVECYLPFDATAFNEFVQKWMKLGSAEAVKKSDPDLADRALTPIDTQGEAMLPDHLLELAHSFLSDCRKMDVMHDDRARDSVQVVQSFVNTAEVASPNFWPGAWVCVLKADPNSDEFARIASGELDPVSFQGMVTKIPITARLQQEPS